MWTVHHVYCVWRNPESRLRDGRVISIMPHGADTDSSCRITAAVTGGQCVEVFDSWIVV
jgi:hypothetical protein